MGVLHLCYAVQREVSLIRNSVPGTNSDLQLYSETTTQGFVSVSGLPRLFVLSTDDCDKMVTYLLATRVLIGLL